MKHRPGVTLLEVLIAIFVLGIGMMALLTLFPLGALNMAQALKDDRCTQAATIAHSQFNALKVASNPQVSPLLGIQPPGATLPPDPNGPGYPVLVDPYYALLGSTQIGTAPNMIPRRGVSFVNHASGLPAATSANRWFSLLDDMTLLSNGLPDTSSGAIDRPNNYTWSYLVRRPKSSSSDLVSLHVIVYHKRSVQVAGGEISYPASIYPGTTNGLLITYGGAVPKPNISRTGWILDVTADYSSAGNATYGTTHGDFYRVVNVTDLSATQVVLELQTDLKPNNNPALGANYQIVVLESASEVFDRGTIWVR